LSRQGEEGGRAVGPLLDVGTEGGPPQHRPHLVGNGGQAGDQDLEGRRIHDPPPPTSAFHPSGSQTVQSGSARTAGPRAAVLSPAGPSSSTVTGAGRAARARRATTSTGAPGRA